MAPMSLHGDLFKAIAPALEADDSRSELEACLDGLWDRLLAEKSDGVLSELGVELAAALPQLAEAGAEMPPLDAFEQQLSELEAESEQREQVAEDVVSILALSALRGEKRAEIPLWGEAIRREQPLLVLQMREGEGGRTTFVKLPACERWEVKGPARDEVAGAVLAARQAVEDKAGDDKTDETVAAKATEFGKHTVAKGSDEEPAASKPDTKKPVEQKAALKQTAEKKATVEPVAKKPSTQKAPTDKRVAVPRSVKKAAEGKPAATSASAAAAVPAAQVAKTATAERKKEDKYAADSQLAAKVPTHDRPAVRRPSRVAPEPAANKAVQEQSSKEMPKQQTIQTSRTDEGLPTAVERTAVAAVAAVAADSANKAAVAVVGERDADGAVPPVVEERFGERFEEHSIGQRSSGVASAGQPPISGTKPVLISPEPSAAFGDKRVVYAVVAASIALLVLVVVLVLVLRN